MEVKVYNQKGEEIGKARLPKEIFEVPLNNDLVHQVAVSMIANKRQPIAHTKDRGEVRGGGKKPWRQKGTGRARVGSNRSPLWIGGGVTFGPRKEKKFSQKIPKKMRRKALFMVLSNKAKENLLVVVDRLAVSKVKTKEMAGILDKLPCKKNSCLIALPEVDKNLILASRNIPTVQTIQAKDLNLLDLLSFKYLLLPKNTLKTLKETFLK